MSDQVYIVLFRGVGGDTKLPTAPLREALSEAGFKNVVTYIATGNVVLASHLKAVTVKSRVAAIASQKFGFAKEIIVVTRREWADLIERNPFPEAVGAPRTLHAFVLTAAPPPPAIAALTARTAPSERLVVCERFLYFHAPDGFGTSKLPAIVDRLLQVTSTARNWNTVVKLGQLAENAAAKL